MRITLLALLWLAAPLPGTAGAQDQSITASNGTKVSVSEEAGAPTVFNGPIIDFLDEMTERPENYRKYPLITTRYSYFATAVKRGQDVEFWVTGLVSYRGNGVRGYSRALLLHGGETQLVQLGKDALPCDARSAFCSFVESFRVALKPEHLRLPAHTAIIHVWLKAPGGADIMLSVPAAHFQALQEVSSVP